MKALAIVLQGYADEMEKLAGSEAIITSALSNLGAKGLKTLPSFGEWLGKPVVEAYHGIKTLLTPSKKLLAQAKKYKGVSKSDKEILSAIRKEALKAIGRGSVVTGGLGYVGWKMVPTEKK